MNPAAQFQPEENRGCFGIILFALLCLSVITAQNIITFKNGGEGKKESDLTGPDSKP